MAQTNTVVPDKDVRLSERKCISDGLERKSCRDVENVTQYNTKIYLAQPDEFAFHALLHFPHSKEMAAQRGCEQGGGAQRRPNQTKDQS